MEHAKLANAARTSKMPPVPSRRVGVAASFTCDPLRRWLEFWLSELGLRVELAFAGYAQLGRELNRPAAYRGADGCVALLNFADWQRTTPLTFDAQRFERDLDLLCEAIAAALPQLSGRLVLLLCPARPVGGSAERAAAFSSATARLKETARREPRLSVLSVAELASWYPVAAPHDRLADELGHVPYSEPMWCAIGAAVARLLLPSLAPPLKCVVLDCDYTLWHHAVGEVGAEGVVVEPRHRELQERPDPNPHPSPNPDPNPNPNPDPSSNPNPNPNPDPNPSPNPNPNRNPNPNPSRRGCWRCERRACCSACAPRTSRPASTRCSPAA